jgi:polyphosphate kinase 1
LPNQSLNLVVAFERPVTDDEDDDELPFAIVEIPKVLAPLIDITQHRNGVEYVRLPDVVKGHLGDLFKGLTIAGAWRFRIIRNSDLSIEEQESDNLMKDLERELRSRTFRRVVRLEVQADMPREVIQVLQEGLEVPSREVYAIDGIMHIASLMGFYGLDRYRYLKDPAFNPRLSPALASSGSIFSILRERAILLHHPYESFSTVAELLHHAAHDPKVLAIKLTLYRTSGDSVIIQALKDAAENGKQVTAVVELKARFDERNNIVWARQLERAGCHVVYGIVGLKTHCKAVMVVRREGSTVRRYVHLSTGNYNSSTARLYTDVALLSQDPLLGEDVSQLFNILTGYNARNIHDIMAGRKPAPTFSKIADSREVQLAGRPDHHCRALSRFVRWREGAAGDSGHLLPAPGHSRCVREHRGDQHCGPLSGARAHHPFPARRRRSGVPELGRLDAAQPVSAHRGDVSGGAGRPEAAADGRDSGSGFCRQRQGKAPGGGRRVCVRTTRRRSAAGSVTEALY